MGPPSRQRIPAILGGSVAFGTGVLVAAFLRGFLVTLLGLNGFGSETETAVGDLTVGLLLVFAIFDVFWRCLYI